MRRAMIWGGAVVCAVALLLSVDWAVATWRGPRDDRLIKAMQEQVKTDASLAPKLAAEQKRITAGRQGRRTRGRWGAWILIAAAGVFLVGAKQVVKPVARKKATAKAAGGAGRRACRAAAATDVDVSFVDEIVARLGRGTAAAIPLLQAIQNHYRYLPDEALQRLCEITEITPAQVAGTSSFYGQFRRSPVGEHVVRVCHGTACHVSGARQVTDELRRHLEIPEGSDTDPSRKFTVDEVACLGCCSLAPVLMVDGQTAGRLTPATACEALDAFEAREKV